MGRIRVHEFMSLDGVIEAPSWTFEFGFDPSMGGDIASVMGGSEAILLGRTTFDMFAPAWSKRTAEEDPGAPFMNGAPKYVVTSKGPSEEWSNSTVLGAYSADAIRKLKASVAGGIYVSGSGMLVRSMLADGLVDELHLFTYPVALGTGSRLFPDGTPKCKLELASCTPYSNGVIHLDYRPVAG